MGGFSFWHLVVIAAVVVVVFWHRHIPAVLVAFGAAIGKRHRKAAHPPPDNVIDGTFTRRDE
jgi:Sec-independent protein translocase protein TatA